MHGYLLDLMFTEVSRNLSVDV